MGSVKDREVKMHPTIQNIFDSMFPMEFPVLKKKDTKDKPKGKKEAEKGGKGET